MNVNVVHWSRRHTVLFQPYFWPISSWTNVSSFQTVINRFQFAPSLNGASQYIYQLTRESRYVCYFLFWIYFYLATNNILGIFQWTFDLGTDDTFSNVVMEQGFSMSFTGNGTGRHVIIFILQNWRIRKRSKPIVTTQARPKIGFQIDPYLYGSRLCAAIWIQLWHAANDYWCAFSNFKLNKNLDTFRQLLINGSGWLLIQRIFTLDSGQE